MTQRPTLSILPDPDEVAFASLGVGDVITGRLLHVAFSRLLGEGRGDRTFVTCTGRLLAGIGQLEFRRADGIVEPAPASELKSTGWSSGPAALLRLGLTSADLDQQWERAQAIDGVHATLPLETVLEFFPAALWPLCSKLLEWGPAETCERLERFARLEALREVKPTIARPEGGTVSASSIHSLLSSGRRMLKVFCELRARAYPAAILERWSTLPRMVTAKEIGAVEANTDRGAPPLMLVRRTLKNLTAEIDRRSKTREGRKRMTRLLRKRLLLALLAVTGVRIGALSKACVGDYDPAHRFPDGQIEPALRIFPAKSIAANEARWKALPALVAAWLEHYLVHLGIRMRPNSSLWPSDQKKDGLKVMRPTSLTSILAGQRTPKKPVRPLLPRPDNPAYGYSAHTLRHLAEQLAYDVGHDHLKEHPEAQSFITPQVLSDALLDHKMSSDHLGYKDLSSASGRERWARVAGLGLWEYLWGDKGARHAPDVDRIEQAVNTRDELQAAQTAVQARLSELRDNRRELERQEETASARDSDELVRLLFRLTALAGALDDEHEELERVQRELHAAEVELQEARRTLVPLPDDAPDPETIEADEEEPATSERTEPARDWLTPSEAATAFAVSEPTMRRWLRGQLPHAEGDPRNPWQPSEADTVVERHGPRKQRLIVSALDRSRIAPEVMRTINELLTQLPN